MAINAPTSSFAAAFGSKKATPAAARPVSEFWLNIGYASGVANTQGEEYFVSIPAGIALDSQEHVKGENSNDRNYAQFSAARNNLLDQLMAMAQAMKPGESKLVDLQVQLRRNAGDKPADLSEENKFLRKL